MIRDDAQGREYDSYETLQRPMEGCVKDRRQGAKRTPGARDFDERQRGGGAVYEK